MRKSKICKGNKHMVIGGILAGGLGTRMTEANLPKQFIKIGTKPVIVHTLQRFLQHKGIDHVIVAMNENWISFCYDLLREYGLDEKVAVIGGGNTRFESLLCLANACMRKAQECGANEDVVMISHDCARPFVSDRILRDNIEMINHYDMVTTSVPTIDTVLISKDGKCSDCVPDRDTVFLDQGPQTIRVRHFMNLVESLTEDEKARYIEAGRLYIEKGFRVGIVEGERQNFKLTTNFDLKLAEMILSEQQK